MPNFTTTLETRGHTFTVHFAALFSEKKDAVPIIMTHGWPGQSALFDRRGAAMLIIQGSFLEFIPLMNHLQSTYKPSELPVHIVCPSIVGFGFSSYPPRHDYMDNLDSAALNDALMRGLGFSKYVAQGGDIGSYISRIMGEKYESCAGMSIVRLGKSITDPYQPCMSICSRLRDPRPLTHRVRMNSTRSASLDSTTLTPTNSHTTRSTAPKPLRSRRLWRAARLPC